MLQCNKLNNYKNIYYNYNMYFLTLLLVIIIKIIF